MNFPASIDRLVMAYSVHTTIALAALRPWPACGAHRVTCFFPATDNLMQRSLLVEGSSGLIGSEVCVWFRRQGWKVHGLDKNRRAVFFSPQVDTRWNQSRLQRENAGFVHHQLDLRDRAGVLDLLKTNRPGMIVLAAAQPSHDLVAQFHLDDFDTNAFGTLNILEGSQQFGAESTFVLMPTSNVCVDGPKGIPQRKLPARRDFDDPRYSAGIAETFLVDQCTYSLFGASGEVAPTPARCLRLFL